MKHCGGGMGEESEIGCRKVGSSGARKKTGACGWWSMTMGSYEKKKDSREARKVKCNEATTKERGLRRICLH